MICTPPASLAPWAAAACLALASAPARAEVVPWLYEVDVPTTATAAGLGRAPVRAASEALGQLLIRVTGLRELPRDAGLRQALDNPRRYYIQYGFLTREAPADENAPADGAEPGKETRLRVRFDTSAVLNLVRDAGLPVWGQDRPRVLAWIVVERRDGERTVVDVDSREAAGEVEDVARRRGIPVKLPLGDLADMTLSATELWGGFADPIEAASRRYGPDVIVAARLHEDEDGVWTADWRLQPLDPGVEAARDIRRQAQEAEAVRWVVDRTADELARRLAVFGDYVDAVTLVVAGADTVPAYARLLQYLGSREYLEGVDVTGWRGRDVALALHSRSDPARLEGLLALGGLLGRDEGRGGPEASLRMNWLGPR